MLLRLIFCRRQQPEWRAAPASSALLRYMLFNVFQALKGLEQRSNYLIDMVANSTGRTVDVAYASLVHRFVYVPLVMPVA